MDNNISIQVKKLIELDQQAVELAKQREEKLNEMEQNHKREMERISSSLQEAKDEAKMAYAQIVERAQAEAEELQNSINQRLQGIIHRLTQAISGLEDELWGKILDSMK